MAKVKAAEGEEDWMDIELEFDFANAIAFFGRIDRFEVGIAFYFVEDKLYSGRYFFTEDHLTANSHLTDFDRIDENLQSKYGSTKVEKEWSNDLYKNLKSMWGDAIEQGHLVLYTQWSVPDEAPITDIAHSLSGGDYEVNHRIEYYSVELYAEVEGRMEEENVF